MVLIPLVLPSFICLFCLGDPSVNVYRKDYINFHALTASEGIWMSSNLDYYEGGVTMICGRSFEPKARQAVDRWDLEELAGRHGKVLSRQRQALRLGRG